MSKTHLDETKANELMNKLGMDHKIVTTKMEERRYPFGPEEGS